ncbi:ATPase [Clostridiales bacterium PH28_bin88]|nr:ATPase [Clostridiales bacterium PH28_bin88]
MKLEFPSLPENVGLARVAVASFAAQDDMTLNDLEEIKVATSEAVSNCLIHGYQHRPDGMVRVEVTRYDDSLAIVVEDDGSGIPDVEQATQPTYSTDPERMGLGFVFMKSFMDEVLVESEVNRGTRVTMVRKIGGVLPAVAHQN